MLTDFTWNEYIMVICFSAAIYYLLILLLFFRKQIADLFARDNSNAKPLHQNPDWPQDFKAREETSEIEGIRKTEETIIFPAFVKNEEFTELDELKEEITSLILLVKEADGTVTELTELLNGLFLNNAHLTTARYRAHLIGFIRQLINQHLSFSIAEGEIQNSFPIEL